MEKNFIILFLISSLFVYSAFSQSGTVASGGDIKGEGGSTAFSIGLIDFTYIKGVNGSVSQGLQQPYKISVISGTEINHINLSAAVYPNPTSRFVVLSIEQTELPQNMQYVLYDTQGRQVKLDAITDLESQIHLTDLSAGTYFLKVLNNYSILKTFQIIKTN